LRGFDEYTVFLCFGTTGLQVGRTPLRSIHVGTSRLSASAIAGRRIPPPG
jgi:hypothetical protein